MKLGPIAQFLLIGVVVGVLLPFILSVCLFSSTLQTFIASPLPTPGYWSGAPTPVPTPPPSHVQIVGGSVLRAAGGLVFVLGSILAACAGEAIAVRRSKEWNATRNAWLGAMAGSVIFIGIALCGFLR
jgi:hypothetical protein